MMEENSCLSSGGCTIQIVKSMEQGQDWPSPGEHRLVSSMGPEGGQTDVVRSANSLRYSQASGSSVCQSTDILPGPKERDSPGIKKGLHNCCSAEVNWRLPGLGTRRKESTPVTCKATGAGGKSTWELYLFQSNHFDIFLFSNAVCSNIRSEKASFTMSRPLTAFLRFPLKMQYRSQVTQQKVWLTQVPKSFLFLRLFQLILG